MNDNTIKVKNLENAINEISRIGKCNWVRIHIENKNQYRIYTNLIRWVFWYNKKEKTITMERV